MTLKKGDMVLHGKFQVERLIGKGGCGEVYLVRHAVLDKLYALKVLRDTMNPISYEEVRQRFEMEAKVGAHLKNLHLIEVYDIEEMNADGQGRGELVMRMEYAPGGSLEDKIAMLKRDGQWMPVAEAVEILLGAAEGLAALHGEGVVHRDVKPSNILFGEGGVVKISDSGLAQIPGVSSRQIDSMPAPHPGTPHYMSPEQANPPYPLLTQPSDVYALGLVLFEMLTGMIYKMQAPEKRSIDSWRGDVPGWLEVLFQEMLAKEPDGRPWDGKALVERLRAGMAQDAEERRKQEAAEQQMALERERQKKKEEEEEKARQAAIAREEVALQERIRKGEEERQRREAEEKAWQERRAREDARRTGQAEARGKGWLGGVALLGVLGLAGILWWRTGIITPPRTPMPWEKNVVVTVIDGLHLEQTLTVVSGIFQVQTETARDMEMVPSAHPTFIEPGETISLFISSTTPTTTPMLTPSETAPATTENLTVWPTETNVDGRMVSVKDGMEQVLVPAGKFWMGSEDSNADDDEKPQHPVTLAGFWIDKYEVTNGQYAQCVRNWGCKTPYDTKSNNRDKYYGEDQYKDYPVIYVDWSMAKAYCEWAGRRLPTEAEWEKAARGMEGRRYPWGDEISCDKVNYGGCKGDTEEVGSYAQGMSPYGAMDMAGNVWEWVADWYGSDYYRISPGEDPIGPTVGTSRVLRGGSWDYNEWYVRAANRNFLVPDFRYGNIGFRCALSQ